MAVARYACAAERSAARKEMGVGGVDAMSRDVATSAVLAALGRRWGGKRGLWSVSHYARTKIRRMP